MSDDIGKVLYAISPENDNNQELAEWGYDQITRNAVKWLTEQAKELELRELTIRSYEHNRKILQTENEQLRKQLEKAVITVRDINYQISQSDHPATMGIAVAINQFLTGLSHIQGKEGNQ